jgi:asparagine synthase (glutamine-hydrolysing)
LIDRPKAGFEVPLGTWLRGPLRPWVESLLDRTALLQQGFLDPYQVGSLWKQHLSGQFDRSLHLWSLLMFQAWLASEARARPSTATMHDRVVA